MSQDDDKPGNVTQLPVRPKDPRKIVERVFTYGPCQHLHTIVDEKLAELTCADCGVKVNPIWFLMQLSNQLRRWEAQGEAARDAMARLAERARCRCTKCGEWTEIRRVHNDEVARLRAGQQRKESSP